MAEPLKDQLFNAQKVRHLAGLFAAADPKFDADAFEAAVMARLHEHELKARIHLIAQCLAQAVPGDLPQIAPVISAALPPPLDPARTDDDFGDFIYAPLGEWVARIGAQEHPELALDLIEEITQRFSMEWAIRPFLNLWPDLVLDRMRIWTDHPSYHVRRLVSEGTRPRLPWGAGVTLGLSDPLSLLDRLHGDPTRFVTRSVANHLNDISKKDPDMVLERLREWAGQGAQSPDELRWMTRHALRGLIKAGHPRALAMLGYDPQADLQVDLAIAPEQVEIGGALTFEVALSAAQDTPVLVDYVLHFHRPDGKRRIKVFKLKQADISAGKPLSLTKRHPLKGNATTFSLTPGVHLLQVQVNGQIRAETEFDLIG